MEISQQAELRKMEAKVVESAAEPFRKSIERKDSLLRANKAKLAKNETDLEAARQSLRVMQDELSMREEEER